MYSDRADRRRVSGGNSIVIIHAGMRFRLAIRLESATAFIGASLTWLMVSVGAWCLRRKMRFLGKKRAAPRSREAAKTDRRRPQAAVEALALTPLRSATV